MSRSTLILFLMGFALATEVAQRCPSWNNVPGRSVQKNVARFFDHPGVEEGTCESGDVYILNGDQFGYPGKKRCVCSRNSQSNFTTCGDGIPLCPTMLPAFKKEDLIAYYKRMYASFAENRVSDGCCPVGTTKAIVTAEEMETESGMCFCVFNNVPPVREGHFHGA